MITVIVHAAIHTIILVLTVTIVIIIVVAVTVVDCSEMTCGYGGIESGGRIVARNGRWTEQWMVMEVGAEICYLLSTMITIPSSRNIKHYNL